MHVGSSKWSVMRAKMKSVGRRDKGEGDEKEGGGLTFGVLCLIVVHESPVQSPLTKRDTVTAVTTIREPTNHSLGGKQVSKINHMK